MLGNDHHDDQSLQVSCTPPWCIRVQITAPLLTHLSILQIK